VNVFIEMSLACHDGFLEKCGPECPEYETLKNGMILRRPKGDHFERIIQIRCDLERAKSLLNLAAEIYPDAVPDIEKAIAASRDS
jgi:hypothetical protein